MLILKSPSNKISASSNINVRKLGTFKNPA